MEEVSEKLTIAHDLAKKPRSSDVQVYGNESAVGFEGLNLSEDILKALEKCSFQKPSPIQLQAIPLGKLGFDLLLQAKSGTGKTCVFSVIALENVDITKNSIQAIVVSPCREIAFQSANVIRALGHFKEGLKVKVFIGGTPVEDDCRRIKKCHIAVGTPGRLVHLIKDFEMDLSKIRVFILDEGDKLLDQSFFPDLQVILGASPKNKQVVVASATYPDNLDEFILTFMRNPIKVQLNSSCPVLLAVEQLALDVRKVMSFKFGDRNVAKDDEIFKCKFRCLNEVLRVVSYSQAIIFCSHQFKAEKVYESLRSSLVDTVLLSGALDQLNRLDSLLQLQKGSCRLMVATDVAARGIDCENLDLVINFDCPTDLATYIHRLGRAGRFGSPGSVVTFLSFKSDFELMEKFELQLNLKLKLIENLSSLEFYGKTKLNMEENVDMLNEEEVGMNELMEDPISHKSNADILRYAKSVNLKEKFPVWQYIYSGIRLDMDEKDIAANKRKYNIQETETG